MVKLVTRNSMMFDYDWICCCSECNCLNENGTIFFRTSNQTVMN